MSQSSLADLDIFQIGGGGGIAAFLDNFFRPFRPERGDAAQKLPIFGVKISDQRGVASPGTLPLNPPMARYNATRHVLIMTMLPDML